MRRDTPPDSTPIALALTLLVGGCGGAAAPAEDGRTYREAEVVDITLAGTSILVAEAANVALAGTVATVEGAGVYRLTGTLDDGQIVVDAGGEDTVQLILAGVDITCTTSAPIFVKNAGHAVILLAEGTQNVLRDTDGYLFEDGEDEPNAPLFSKDELTIFGDGDGTGALTVHARFEDGIVGKDGLTVDHARVFVTSEVDDGIRGKDYLVVRDSEIEVMAADDALRSTNDSDPALGYVQIDSGALVLVAGADGIQAETALTIAGGALTITAGGGADAAPSGGSTKGLKAGLEVTIAGGELFIDAADDAVHADRDVRFTGGALVVRASGDGLHAKDSLRVEGGAIEIAQSHAGLQAAAIEVTGGEVRVVADGDGINVVDGEDASEALVPARHLHIEGGYLHVAAGGDGVDVDADIAMSGGTLIVDGPSTALDFDGAFEMAGGLLVAAQPSEDPRSPGATSSQATLTIYSPEAFDAGTLVHIESDAGDDLLTLAPQHPWRSVVFSAPSLIPGLMGTVWTGGAATFEPIDGLYTGSEYSPGTQRAAFSISSAVNSVAMP